MVDAAGSGRNNRRIRLVAIIALVLGLTVPVTQLRASTVVQAHCCCPDPSLCHCPARPERSDATVRPCGKTTDVVVATTLAAFTSPPLPAVAGLVAAPAPELPLAPPHAPPEPRRPAAPS